MLAGRMKSIAIATWLTWSVLAAPLTVQAAGESDLTRAVFPVRVVQGAEERIGTAVVIGREDRGAGNMVYFLTSSRLFKPFASDRRTIERSVRLILDPDAPTRQVDIRPDNLFVPEGGLTEVAVFRAVIADTSLAPQPVLYEAPPSGAVFMIAGFDRYGARAAIGQHIGFTSARLAAGDRDASMLRGCIGAPAIGPDGIFGVVNDCSPDRSPVVTLLSFARSFIESHVPPHFVLTRSRTPAFAVTERQIQGAAAEVDCTASPRQFFDIPVQLQPGETFIGATGVLQTPREVPIGEAVVMKRDDRVVRLRFTVGSGPKPPGAPLPCPTGQALISVRLRLAVVPQLD